MTWGMTAQRRAEEFDALVSGRSTDAARDESLLTLVSTLRSLPEVHARPDFVSDLRAQLMVEAETALVPDDVSRLRLPQRHTRRERRIAALVGGIALVGATTSVAVAAQSALPGESLYPVKRAIESAQTTVSLDQGAKGSAMLGNASSRLDEARQLSQQLDRDGRVAEALSTFTDQATSAADLLLADYADHGHDSSIQALRDFASTSLAELQDLEPMVPYDARDELLAAAAALSRIDGDAAARCGACDPAPLAALPIELSGEQIVLPTLPTLTTSPVVAERQHPGKAAKGDRHPSSLPSIGPASSIGPGSVSQPDEDSSPSADPSRVADPLTQLAHSVLGGGRSNAGDKTQVPVPPVVSDLAEGVGALISGAIDPVTGLLVQGLAGQDGPRADR